MKTTTQDTGERRMLKRGTRGDDVRDLQRKLARLGFDVDADGAFGDQTEQAVLRLQTSFGYTVDGIVGDGTRALIDAQLGYGWSAKAPDAEEMARRSQRRVSGSAKEGGASNVAAVSDAGHSPPTPSGVKGGGGAS